MPWQVFVECTKDYGSFSKRLLRTLPGAVTCSVSFTELRLYSELIPTTESNGISGCCFLLFRVIFPPVE